MPTSNTTSKPGIDGRPHCQALRLEDEQRCTQAATDAKQIFCSTHARQCYGMYRGYKRRNAKLDSMVPPPYLANAKTQLAANSFADLDSVSEIRQVLEFMHAQFSLLDRVVMARVKHSKHFFPEQLDYGHKAFVDKLVQQRHTVENALNRLVKRYQQVAYHNEKWFQWVAERQKEQDASEEKLKKKVKLEAAMFRRHLRQVEERLDRRRVKERKRRQDADLERAFQERLTLADVSDADDPIDNLVDDSRSRYIELIMHFLWMDNQDGDEESPVMDFEETAEMLAQQLAAGGEKNQKKSKSKSKSRKKKPKDQNTVPDQTEDHTKAAVKASSSTMSKAVSSKGSVTPAVASQTTPEPDKTKIETRAAMRDRLRHGVDKDFSSMTGPQVLGTYQEPYELRNKTAPIPEEEIRTLLGEITEVKRLLFCRLLLSHSSLLPIALQSSTIEEFLANQDVTEADLRDICLRLEDPSVQDIRDACADLMREDDQPEEDRPRLGNTDSGFGGGERSNGQEDDDGQDAYDPTLDPDDFGAVDFGAVDDTKPQQQRIKVTVCGKTIWNYASEKAMSRDGWLQFSIMAKDARLDESVQLCRHWDEFSDLNNLALWNFFPAAKWTSWAGHQYNRQLLEKGFIPYWTSFDYGDENYGNEFISRGSMATISGNGPRLYRSNPHLEQRNFICGHMKRNDPITRRFIQTFVTNTGDCLIFVRDAKTGRIITAPPEEERWIIRERPKSLSSYGDGGYVDKLRLNESFFKAAEDQRSWRFGFKEYYDIVIWDRVPNRPAMGIYNLICTSIMKAVKIKSYDSMYDNMESFLRTLTRDKHTHRVRRTKPGEQVKSLWDIMMRDTERTNVSGLVANSCGGAAPNEQTNVRAFYNESDAAEDAVLFPEYAPPQQRQYDNNFGLTKQMTDPKDTFRRELHKVIKGQYVRGMSGGLSPSSVRLTKGPGVAAQHKAMFGFIEPIASMPFLYSYAKDLLNKASLDSNMTAQLEKIGVLPSGKKQKPDIELWMETLEMRCNAFACKEAFHRGDLEPGARDRYRETTELVNGIKNSDAIAKAAASSTHKWAMFCLEILGWLGLHAEDFHRMPSMFDARIPWPNCFLAQDLVQAYAMMALFFPGLKEEVEPVQCYLESSEGKQKYCSSGSLPLLLDQRARATKLRPDRRTGTSFRQRPKSFWKEWHALFFHGGDYFADIYPMEGRLALRPIIAQLYKAGIVKPAYAGNEPTETSGFAVANTEPHRPGKRDLFLCYENWGTRDSPDRLLDPKDWPDLRAVARKFAITPTVATATGGSGGRAWPRFALLRLWSAPHFWPMMISGSNAVGSRFLDSEGRVWEWRFLPKDWPFAEQAVHNVGIAAIAALQEALHGTGATVAEHIVHRGDLFLVMAFGERDLLRWCVALALALQTKPWHREVDLWRSFVNVDLDFLEGLDAAWFRF